MAARKSAINLLPKSAFELSFWGRFLKWSLSAGRYTIILTELVVIIAFLSRFKLDKDLLDLNDKIEGQKVILEATANIESTFLSIKSRLGQVRYYLDHEMHVSQTLDEITKIVPPGVTLTQIIINTNDMVLTANTTSEASLGTLINQAKANKNWSSVSISDITSTTENNVTVGIKISF